MISDYEAALIQDSTQIKQKNMFNSPYPTLPSQISNGVTAKTLAPHLMKAHRTFTAGFKDVWGKENVVNAP